MVLQKIPVIEIEQVERQIKTYGHSPYIVIADSCQYVMKLAQNNRDSHSILKEFICGQMLKLWGIPTPEIVGLSVPPNIINSTILVNERRLSYTSIYFGSKSIQIFTEVQKTDVLRNKKDIARFRNLNLLLDIAFFDIWMENDDRKPTNCNLLYAWKEKLVDIVAIDHAFTLGSIDFEQLNPAYLSFSDNDSILYSKLGISFLRRQKLQRGWAAHQKSYFLEKINLIKENFQHICNNIPKEISLQVSEIELLEKHLFNEDRINHAFTAFIRIVKDCKKNKTK